MHNRKKEQTLAKFEKQNREMARVKKQVEKLEKWPHDDTAATTAATATTPTPLLRS